MGDYERTERINASADELFDYLSDLRNLPRYFAAMTSAEPAAGDAVRVTAVVDGHEHESEAWLRVDRDRKHLDWGSKGPNNYHGRLDVNAAGDASRVSVSLHTDDTDDARIDQGLDDTLAEIKRLVEAGPGPDGN